MRISTPEELRAWALKLMAKYPPGTSPGIYDLGTNFPPKLLRLCSDFGPCVSIAEGDKNSRFVRVFWVGGIQKPVGFDIGPTNFVEEGEMWRPGIYIHRD